jgi:hypothetical protein
MKLRKTSDLKNQNMVVCKCGQPIESWETNYVTRRYGKFGEVIFEICKHGIVTVNEEDSQ